MAAALLVHRLAEIGIDAEIGSAGLLQPGHPASPEAIATLAARGIDLSRHRTRRLDADLVADADLVLGMERRHVRAAAVLIPNALVKTFSLKELVRRALHVGPRPADEAVGTWLGRLGEGRDTGDLVRDDDRDTVDDPIGCGPDAYRRCADELDLLVQGVRYFVWEGPAHPEHPEHQGRPHGTPVMRPASAPGAAPPPATGDRGGPTR
jgi:protein-tyrosine phosphatase